jgi:tetratricopeptide (TPR) repeat protein
MELAPIDEAAQALALRAGEQLGRAARRAMQRADVAATIGLTERALALLPEVHELRPGLLSDLGYSLRERGDLDAAAVAFENGLVAADGVGDRAARALIGARIAALQTMRGGTMDEGLAILHANVEELEALGDEGALAEVLFLLGYHISWTDGDATDVLERGAAIARRLGNLRLEASCIGWLCVDAFWYEGSIEEGLSLCSRVLDRPDPGSEAGRLLLIAGNFKRMMGREEEGNADIAEGISQLMELGRTVDAHAYTMANASVSLLAGRFEEAGKMLGPARDALKAYGETGYLSTVSGLIALALAAQGQYDEADPFAEEARALGAEDDVSTQAFWRAAKGRILSGRGDHAAARELTEESLALLSPRRTLDQIILLVNAAEVHRAAGRVDEAKRLLERSIEVRGKKGILLGDAWLEELLAAV